MSYQFDFASLWPYVPALASGLATTLALTAVSAVAGIAVGVAGAVARDSSNRFVRTITAAYVELVRNTPFLVQLFFIFFGLPSLGIRLPEWVAAVLAMVVNLGAYATEIIRAGVAATPKGLIEAGESLAMSRGQVFRYIVIGLAMRRIWPSLTGQIIIVMLGSSVCSQIAVEELSFVASFVQSRTFQPFEIYSVTIVLYLVASTVTRRCLSLGGNLFFGRRRARV